ncbi:uncharacterized protein TM35_000581180 [Trypanosoma theileri]|uniref:Mucin TcMUCII n=1 Tax=Trypanosoma theileri TaxID=67003 RepID=A0A1X0NGC2_9TRYP|nr:uncharacterized protein TM35_000581180 [Trypanosoma theileri]ORC83755.1 hypothetical protein TM35_000581180 [Trypanosoma theileri]
MTKAVMVRCYLLCLLTLALCCVCGLVWAETGKTSKSSNCVNYVGVPPFIKTVPCDKARTDPNPSEGSAVESSDDGETGGKGNNTTREGENGDNNGTVATQPSADSPNTSETGSGDGSDTATPGNGTVPAESESTGNQEEVADNTDPTTTTTTTTTTLPPELTNNKKDDADSSSSIISFVWVRIPLLIVVTLACILVC